MLEKVENAAIFLRLDVPSILIRHENEAFRKLSSNWMNLKNASFAFQCGQKTFSNRSFLKFMTSR